MLRLQWVLRGFTGFYWVFLGYSGFWAAGVSVTGATKWKRCAKKNENYAMKNLERETNKTSQPINTSDEMKKNKDQQKKKKQRPETRFDWPSASQ